MSVNTLKVLPDGKTQRLSNLEQRAVGVLRRRRLAVAPLVTELSRTKAQMLPEAP